MVLFYLVIFAVLLVGVKVRKKGDFYEDFMGKEQCNAMKGLFIFMVFLSHGMMVIKGCEYDFDMMVDHLGMKLRSEFGQLIVVMFLFYSGFGIMESIKQKGKEYVKTFPKRRILTVLLNFDIAVVLFVVLDLILGIHVGLKKVVLSLLAWQSVGNSNWYIFVILYCYVMAYLVFRLLNQRKRLALVIVTFLVVLGIMALSYQKQSWWYDTMLCFPAGMAFSYYKEGIVAFFKSYYWIALICVFTVFFVIHSIELPALHGFTHNIKSLAFAMLVLLLTMKIKTGNGLLYWMGINLFPIYVYQRIPMIAIKSTLGDAWICSYPYLFMVLCCAITMLIAYFYKYWQVKLT